MAKGIVLNKHELKIKQLESRLRELEQANLLLQEYFCMTTSKDIVLSRASPFNGNPVFSQNLYFTIDLKIQKLVWLNSTGNLLNKTNERLFLKGVNVVALKLISTPDRKRFKSIIAQFTESNRRPLQTILRIKHSDYNLVWVLACFERVNYQNQSDSYLQVQFIQLEETKELADLFYEFIKYSESDGLFQKVEMLTERQREVLVLLGKGLTSKEIAGHLNISFHTVEAHRKSIAKKTQTSRRAALISLAAEVGIIR